MKNIIIGIMAVVIVVLLTVITVAPGGKGGTTNFDGIALSETFSVTGASTLTGGVTVGSSGTALSKMLMGTCNITQAIVHGAMPATTTSEFFCDVTGVASGDKVFVSLPRGAGSTSPTVSSSIFGGFLVNSAYSTTTNRIGMSILNMTGAATSSFPQATTSVQYWVIR